MQCAIVRKSSSDVNEFELLERRVNCDTDLERRTIIAMSLICGVIYAAVRRIDKTTGVLNVIARLYVIEQYPRLKNRYEFSYKEVAEEMGPFHSRCPTRILDLLTPTTDEAALRWRSQCREQNAWRVDRRAHLKAISAGALLKFPKALSLGAAGETDTLRVENIGKRLFSVPNKDLRVRLHYSTLLKGDFEVSPAPGSEQLSLAVM